MEDLVKKVIAAANITEEQAKKAIDTTMAFVKEKAGDSVFEKLGGWAGEAKSKATHLAEDAKEKLEDLAEDAGEALDKAKGFASKMWDKVTGGDDKEEEKKEEPKK
jgi:V/A-type H+/Na+-transporting ATPase subunit G/H